MRECSCYNQCMNVLPLMLESLTKCYGASPGIADVDLQVEPGEVFGFLGPNGAGKTTAIRTMMNFLQPTSGSISILGLDSVRDSVEINRRVGYLAGDFAMYDNLTGRQYLEFIANVRGLKNTKKRIAELQNFFEAQLDKKIATLSRGNTQKIGLIAAVLHDPELLILDEPTTGLDPLMQNRFFELVRTFSGAGKTVFMSSHILSDVQEVCDRVAFMKNGKMIDVIDINAYRSGNKKEVRITFSKPTANFMPGPKEGVTILHQTKKEVRFTTEEPAGLLLARLSKYAVSDVTIQDVSLDDLFLKLYGAAHEVQRV